MSQRRDSNLKTYLNFSWGSGNDFLLWNRASKKPITVELPEGINKNKIFNQGLLINWEECDKTEGSIIRVFAQNLYQFHLQKLELLNDEQLDEDKQKDTLMGKVKEANFFYANALAKAAEAYKNDNQDEKTLNFKALEYTQFFLIWKLTEIFYMREQTVSKTQEFANWVRLFPDIKERKLKIEHRGQCDWETLFFYLGLGDLENVIAILKNIKPQDGNKNEAMAFAFHETIEVLRKKIKYFKGDDCPYTDRQSFYQQAEKERERLSYLNSNKIHLKWGSESNENQEFIMFLRVLTGDVHAIETVSGQDWKLYLNLIFLFKYPFGEKKEIEPLLEEYANKNKIFESDRIFMSIIVNPRAFTFIQSILGQIPAWFTFHLSDLLYLFKQIPTEPIIFNENDKGASDLAFFDIVLHEMFGYLIQAKAPFDVIKYYVYYLFQIYFFDGENKVKEEYLSFVDQICSQRMDSYVESDIIAYLEELNNQIFLDIDDLSNGLFQDLKNSLLKRLARNYTSVKDLEKDNILASLEIIERIQDPQFSDEYAETLLKEYEEKGNEAIAELLKKFEEEGSPVFQGSEAFNFLLNISKFKKCLEPSQRDNAKELQEAKKILFDLISGPKLQNEKRLLVLSYAIDLFERVKFTPEEIHDLSDEVSNIENLLKFEMVKDKKEEKNYKNYKKIIQSVKLCLMRSLSRSVINENKQ